MLPTHTPENAECLLCSSNRAQKVELNGGFLLGIYENRMMRSQAGKPLSPQMPACAGDSSRSLGVWPPTQTHIVTKENPTDGKLAPERGGGGEDSSGEDPEIA